MNKRVPEILIEQYALGELSDEDARRVEESDGFRARLEAIHESNREILDLYPPEAFAVRIKNRTKRGEATEQRSPSGSVRRRVHWAWAAPALLAAAAAFAFGVWYSGSLPGSDVEGTMDEITRLKGSEPALYIYRNASGEAGSDPERLADGANAGAGDRLQLAYNAGGMAYGVIVSLDGNGTVTLHYPLSVSGSPELDQGGDQQLPYGYQLDDAPQFERFYLITSEEPFDVSRLVQQFRSQAERLTARPDGSPEIGDNFTVVSVTLEKGE